MQKDSTYTSSLRRRLRLPLLAGGILLVVASLVTWGGTARPGPLFVAGVALLAGLWVAFGALTWWLFLSPLRAEPRPAARSAASRAWLAGLVALAGTSFVAGGFWDELWHREFGGFGDDFLWPPHLMLYGSIALVTAFAAAGLFVAVRGRGGLRERFRAEPLVGLLGLVSAYLVASLPSDELWHRVYGIDLTAWSLPHIIIAAGFATILLVAVSLQLSLLPRGAWQTLRGLRAREWPALWLIALAGLVLLQVGTAEWEGVTASAQREAGAFTSAFWARPEWLYPVVVISIALFIGNFALHALRRAGAATLVALLAFAFRAAALALTGAWREGIAMGLHSHVLLLVPLLALDAYYGVRLGRADQAGTQAGGNLAAALAFFAVGLPFIALTMRYPAVNAATLPGMLLWGTLLALAAGWAGARAGTWLGGLQAQAAAEVRG